MLSSGPQPETSFNLGNCHYAQENYGDAVRCFTRATNIDPEYVEAWNNLGNALGDLSRGPEAAKAYRRALVISPTYADAHYNLAETLSLTGDLRRARRHWQEYLRQDPNSSWAKKVRDRLRETEGL